MKNKSWLFFPFVLACNSNRHLASSASEPNFNLQTQELLDQMTTENYESSRTRFLDLAREFKKDFSHVEISSWKLPNANDDELYLDSLYLSSTSKPRNLIILTSGIHGVEAAAGAVQVRYILSQCIASIETENTALLIIHTLNPYGYKYGRRFNSHNVDLNRNFFDARKKPFPGKAIQNDSYEKMRDLLESEANSIEVLWNGLQNRTALTKALSGQYQSPKGFYYGGQKVEPENRHAQELMEAKVVGAKNVFHLDFHTGLGDRGIMQIMMDAPPKLAENKAAYQRELKLLREILFPASECKGVCTVEEATEHDFITNGDIVQWLPVRFQKLRQKHTLISVTAETGTEGPLQSLPAMINENYCEQNPEKCSDQKKRDRKEKLRKTFFPTDQKWAAQLMRGSEQACRALSRFSRLQ